MDSFHEPFREAGATIDLLDLHAEGFDPRFTQADFDHFRGGPLSEDVAEMQRRVEGTDRLAFVFPIYWWGMPASMKGWIERVFTPGWAYQDGTEARNNVQSTTARARLRRVPTLLIGTGGADQATYDRYGYDEAMRTQLDVGIFSYCGLNDVESHLILDIDGDENAANRVRGRERAREIAEAFLSPDRVPRDAKREHLERRRLSVA